SPRQFFEVCLYDIKTGALSRRLTPYWWVLPATLCLILEVVSWLFVWCRFSAANDWPIALDWAFIVGIPLYLLGTRLLATIEADQSLRHPTVFGGGLALACVPMSIIWFFFGKERLGSLSVCTLCDAAGDAIPRLSSGVTALLPSAAGDVASWRSDVKNRVLYPTMPGGFVKLEGDQYPHLRRLP
ncbi:MAG: hypothetical protein KDB00_28450, partial [Planctomycetales bacterium]|nr:hypothetical protein [Planctomycetales bacterium]